MLTTLLLGVLYAAPPMPTDAAPRIEGLRDTWVTPSAWVPSLRPSRPLPQGPARIAVLVDAQKLADPSAITTLLGAQEAVIDVQGEGHDLLVRLDPYIDLASLALPDGRLLGTVADITVVPRALPPRLPGASDSVVTPGPSPRTQRPFPPPPVPDVATGWDLRIHNPHLGGPSDLAIEGLGLGRADPDSTVVLHDVAPGVYQVRFTTPTGAVRIRSIATERGATAPPPPESSPPSPR